MGTRWWNQGTQAREKGVRGHLGVATQTLVYATLASAVLTLLAVIVPLAARRRELAGYRGLDLLASCAYFGFIGLGFMLVEIGLLSRLNVFLGHPTLALAALLGGSSSSPAWAAWPRDGSTCGGAGWLG